MNQKGFTPHYLRDNKKTGEKRTKNSAGFIPIILIIIGAVVVASATFGVVKYKDEITATVSGIFVGFKVEILDIDSTGETPQLSDESEGQGEVIEEVEIIEEPIIPAESLEDIQAGPPSDQSEGIEMDSPQSEGLGGEEAGEETTVEEEVIEEITEEEVIEESVVEPEELSQSHRSYGGFIMTGTPNPSPEPTPSSPVIISHEDNQTFDIGDDEIEGVQITLSGAAEPGATVLIQVNPTYETTADENGNWEKEITLYEGENTVTITVRNSVGQESNPTVLTFYVEEDTTAPVISNITVSDITENSAQITWYTDEDSDSVVEYGLASLASGSYDTVSADTVASESVGFIHTASLSNLEDDNSVYYYKVVSTDGSDNQSESDEDTFLTLLNPPIVTSHTDNEAVNTNKVKLQGTAEPNATIFIQVNSSDEITTTAEESGEWIKKRVALEEGENTISIKAENDDGDESRTIILTLYRDTESPTATIGTNYDPENPSLNFTVEWSSSEPDCTFKVKYKAPGESSFSNLVEPGTSSTSQDFHASAGNGTYEFKAKATDLAGNRGEWSEVVKVVVEVEDTIQPVITLEGELTVNLTVGDDYIDEGATALDDVDGDLTDSIEVDGLDEIDTSIAGTYIITYNVSDATGNEADEVTRTVIVEEEEDTTPPTVVDLYHNHDDLVVRGADLVNITVVFSEEMANGSADKPIINLPTNSGSEEKKMSGSGTTWEKTWNVPGSYDGEDVITVGGADLAGNAYVYTDEDKLVFIIDNTDPETEIEITNYASDSYDFTVNWSSSEDPNCTFEVQYKYRAPGESWTDWTDLIEPGTSSTLYNFTAENGKYKFKARATDLAGNKAWSDVVVVEVSIEEP